jgi:hypothetical protein
MASLSSILLNNPEINFKESDRLYYNQFPIKISFRSSVTVKHFNEPYKTRRNGSGVTIFVLSHDAADRIIDHLNKYYSSFSQGQARVESIIVGLEFPITKEREIQLSNDKIFRNKNFKYQYRVAITDGLLRHHTPAVKELLKSIAEDRHNFQCNNGMLHRLRAFNYLYNNYYYCNDLGHITWIRLLDPSFIKKIQEVVKEK